MIDKITDEKKKSWEEVITSTDLIHNSYRAWQTIRKLSNNHTTPNPPCLVNAKRVLHQLLINGRGTIPTKPMLPILPAIQEGTPTMAHSFSEEEYIKGIAALKNNKAAGRGDVLVEQLKHLCPKPINGYIQCSGYASQENISPRYGDNPRLSPYSSQGKTPRFRRTTDQSPSYTNKLYERMILNRIAPVVEQRLIKEQAGVMTGKSCTSQLLNLTQHIEDGCQRGMTTDAAFVDLSAAYDTVNHRILIQKLYNITQDSPLCRVIQNMMSSGRFNVNLSK